MLLRELDFTHLSWINQHVVIRKNAFCVDDKMANLPRRIAEQQVADSSRFAITCVDFLTDEFSTISQHLPILNLCSRLILEAYDTGEVALGQVQLSDLRSIIRTPSAMRSLGWSTTFSPGCNPSII